MFNSLNGTITAKLPQTLYLETGGIEWDISMPDTALNSLPSVGEKVRVYTWLQHREDSMKLFGFSSKEERSAFLDLLKVDGVGTKGALKILSGISLTQLSAALDSQDLAQLERLPGVGKKTAQKMMLTLKGKLTLDTNIGQMQQRLSNIPPQWQDVTTALTEMGYDRRSCEEVIIKLQHELSADFEGKTQAQKEEIMFRKAIVELA
ncbi:MAG: Holliday junction branch migration protein RuvA [Spirochaetaceae bacterium]|nr:Holliday junction branch migration protein RuvA [Spirochaetaceae bacterium]